MKGKIKHAFIGKSKIVLTMSKVNFHEEFTDEMANEYLVELGILGYGFMDKFETSQEASMVYKY